MGIDTAKTVTTLFRKEILTRWGVSDFLVSDRGTQFVSAVFNPLKSRVRVYLGCLRCFEMP